MSTFIVLSHLWLITATLYSLVSVKSFRMYTILKMAESIYVILTSLLHKSSFRLKHVVLSLYAIGDLVIQYTMVPAIICFLCGHLVLFAKFRPKIKHLLGAVPLGVVGPVFFYVTDHCNAQFSVLLFVYAVILATTFTSSLSQSERALSVAALLFFISDMVLSVKEFSADLLGDSQLQVARIIVILTYYAATITYAVRL